MGKLRFRVSVIFTVVVVAIAATLSAEPVKLATPVGMVEEKTDKQKIGVFVQAYY